MTISKDLLVRAFYEVYDERAPDPDALPDVDLSQRFQNRMERLVRREATHPWATRHPTARALLIAAVILILLFILAMSVSAIRDPIIKFFTVSYPGHDEVIFTPSDRKEIEHYYEISAIPDGFKLNQSVQYSTYSYKSYEKKDGSFILFKQTIPTFDQTHSVDNDDSENTEISIDGQTILKSVSDDDILLMWEMDGYVFVLEIQTAGITLEQALDFYRSIK